MRCQLQLVAKETLIKSALSKGTAFSICVRTSFSFWPWSKKLEKQSAAGAES